MLFGLCQVTSVFELCFPLVVLCWWASACAGSSVAWYICKWTLRAWNFQNQLPLLNIKKRKKKKYTTYWRWNSFATFWSFSPSKFKHCSPIPELQMGHRGIEYSRWDYLCCVELIHLQNVSMCDDCGNCTQITSEMETIDEFLCIKQKSPSHCFLWLKRLYIWKSYLYFS